jgi:hypothetical protein
VFRLADILADIWILEMLMLQYLILLCLVFQRIYWPIVWLREGWLFAPFLGSFLGCLWLGWMEVPLKSILLLLAASNLAWNFIDGHGEL